MMTAHNTTLKYWITSAAIPLVLLSACSGDPKSNSKGAGAEKPAQPYKVMEIALSNTVISADYPATLQGVQDIDIRPRIDGYVEAVYVDEGSVVKKGQALFKINNLQYDEQVRSASGAIASAEASVASARLQVNKTQPLVDKDIISPYELETAKLNLRASEAALTQAKANLANAKINQGYTTVTSPVNGVVGAIPMRLGSYVSSATATPLTTVSDISKIYAYFSINEKQQLDFFKSTTGNTFQQKITQLPAVQLILSDGTSYDINGKVETFSGQINKQTGSFNVRAGFQNPTGILRSGSSAVVRIPTQVNNAIVIPQTATYDIQGKKFTYILNEDNTIKAAPITVRAIPGGKFYVVDEGLTAAQKILIEGAGILTEGTKVIPQLTQRDSVLAVAP